ncbi:DUF5597 domain-containing protein [Flavobacterium sp. HJJ]|uniref:GH35 family beta-galactosidase n=1 Tax=Flavobacterium sp. HJJ TaxID=2783792 RepID=UPI00188D1E6F|nr:DUF5597 domain-containing protein [Flavobacterium sp. HJJ]MBF4473035.1 DUF5597 domain-containing protein [Flavobacterium sp. HJJ]
MKKILYILTLSIATNLLAQKQILPRLEKINGKTNFIVNGKPFLMLSGELHNSSAGSAHYMRPIWKQLKNNNLNTVIAPVSWELIEPVEGKFDFTLVDSMIVGARKEKLKLVVLWFGTWKNAKSTYVPEWIKRNTAKYPLMESQGGRSLNTLSTFSENSLTADAKAFSALMNHIKKVDSKEQTVIMMQVQNEVGILGSPRDYSQTATKAFEGQVPQELMAYLAKNKSSLYPGLLKVWEANGSKMNGTWEEVFGKGEKYKGEDWKNNYSFYTEEIFMAWNLAKYIGKIAQKGKEQYALPMFANGWIKQPKSTNPGRYPSGGPLPQVLDIWRAAAPAIDLIAADIYAVEEFDWVCKEFSLSQNPLFIPETTPDLGGSARALYAFGKYHAIGYAPFGIDGNGLFNTADLKDVSLKKVYDCLKNISSEISKYRGTANLTGLYLGEGDTDTSVEMGDFAVYMSRFSSAGLFKKTGGRFGIAGEEDRSPAGLVVIKLNKDEFLVAGGVGGIQVTVSGSKTNTAFSDYISVDEITFEKGKMRSHSLNGDETALGGAIIKPGEVKIFKIKVYNY